MLSRLSIRARITLGSLAIALVLLVAALIVVRVQVAGVLADADVSLARSDLTSFEKDIAANPTESVDDPGTGVLVYVRNPDGEVQVDTLPHDVRVLVEGLAASNQQYPTTDDEGRSFVVVGRTVSTADGDWGLWSARSTSASELALRGLDAVLIVSGIVLLIGFGAASWLLASLALRPVTAMRQRAERLGGADADGRLPVGRARDELAALATTLNLFLDRVQDSTAREKQMVSDAAHELRTPLAALKTQLELAGDDVDDPAQLLAELRAAGRSVDRLTSLASNLLELSRLESDAQPAARSTAPALVGEFLGSIDRARMLGSGSNIDVGFELGVPDDAATYAVDAQAFGRLCDNLLSNAVHALGRRDGADGRIRGTLGQSEGRLILEVSDDGPGMPESFLPMAFERFTRPDVARATSAGGSGLGLALVKAIAEGAGGSATVQNGHPGLLVTVLIPQM